MMLLAPLSFGLAVGTPSVTAPGGSVEVVSRTVRATLDVNGATVETLSVVRNPGTRGVRATVAFPRGPVVAAPAPTVTATIDGLALPLKPGLLPEGLVGRTADSTGTFALSAKGTRALRSRCRVTYGKSADDAQKRRLVLMMAGDAAVTDVSFAYSPGLVLGLADLDEPAGWTNGPTGAYRRFRGAVPSRVGLEFYPPTL